ncbi:H-NS histone family protein [Noviherbaspirillum pedocola]|uniref:H-NS histone family protein n=1 Tax=Noviherbaspirillum pedocola TaxID=2801341 RepID=A0A934SXI1_9BURK|nr:H-NS histone family protein [Noviherbaspirillum pedocola]MBK4737328.1 H-NS histone family protein [Noviherbaspirillum pedocola]
MATYKDIQNQIAELQRAAEEARAKEVQGAVEQIRTLMADYDLSIEDIQGASKGKKSGKGAKSKAQGKVQYRDNDGNTWSGRGRMPGWLHGKDKEQFRVA